MLRMSRNNLGIGVSNLNFFSQHAAARCGSKLAKCATHGTQAVHHAWPTPQQAAASPTASGCPPATGGMPPADYPKPTNPHATIFSHTYCTHEYFAYMLQSYLHLGELSDSAYR